MYQMCKKKNNILINYNFFNIILHLKFNFTKLTNPMLKVSHRCGTFFILYFQYYLVLLSVSHVAQSLVLL